MTILIGFLTCGSMEAISSVTIHAINKNWKYRQAGAVEWFAATVPGCVHTDLIDNKKIEDPFYLNNEKNPQ